MTRSCIMESIMIDVGKKIFNKELYCSKSIGTGDYS